MEFLEKVWTYRQFFLDHKLAVFALLVPTTCSILLFLLVYYNLPDRAIGNTLKSPNFLVPWVLLIVFTASVFMLAGRNVPPPEDGNLYVTVARLGNTEDAKLLQQTIEDEFLKWLDVVTNLRIKRSAILETVRHQKDAEKYGKKRSVHFVLYGAVTGEGGLSTKRVYQCELVQTWPFGKSTPRGKYVFSGSFDSSEPKEIRKVARDLVVKIIKIYDTNRFLAKSGRSVVTAANVGLQPGKTGFNVGSNHLWAFNIAEEKPKEAFLSGRTGIDGKFWISGRLFDSDGSHVIEILDNQIVQTGEISHFTVRTYGEWYSIRDSYGRIILKVKNEEDLDAYFNDLNQFRLSDPILSKMGGELGDERKAKIKALKSLITVTSEVYNSNGMPVAFIDRHQAFLFLTGLGIPLKTPGYYEAEAERFEKIAKENPVDTETLFYWGLALEALNNYVGAAEKFRKVTEIDPDNTEALFEWGRTLGAQKDHQGAAEKFKKVTEINPEYPDAFFNWGLLLYELKDYEGAIQKFEKAAEVDTKDVDAFFNWGQALRQLKDHEGAAEKFRVATELDPTNARAFFRWGFELGILKNYEGAAEKFKKVTELEPENAPAFFWWGQALKDLRDYEGAAARYERAIEINSRYARAYFEWGYVLCKLSRCSDAIEKYRMALKINPKYVHAHFRLALLLRNQGDSKGAIESYNQVIELEPDGELAKKARTAIKELEGQSQ